MQLYSSAVHHVANLFHSGAERWYSMPLLCYSQPSFANAARLFAIPSRFHSLLFPCTSWLPSSVAILIDAMPLLLRTNPRSSSAALSMHFQSWSFQCISVAPHISASLFHSNSIYLITDPLRSDSLHCISVASHWYALPLQFCAMVCFAVAYLYFALQCRGDSIHRRTKPFRSDSVPLLAVALPFGAFPWRFFALHCYAVT